MFSAKFVNLAVFGLLLQTLFCNAANAVEFDFNKEKYWLELLKPQIKIGEIIELKTADKAFFGIYTKQTTAKLKGSIILLPDKAAHPNWPNVIKPLRIKLADKGWATLAIQLPQRAKALSKAEDLSAFYQGSFPRIESAIAYLREKNTKPIILLGHGIGANIAMFYGRDHRKASEQKKPIVNIGALVAISLGHNPQKKHPHNTIPIIETIDLPILDIYAMDDLDIVVASAKLRSGAAKRGNKKDYVQQQVFGAHHDFVNEHDVLVKRIHSWLSKVFKYKKLTPLDKMHDKK